MKNSEIVLFRTPDWEDLSWAAKTLLRFFPEQKSHLCRNCRCVCEVYLQYRDIVARQLTALSIFKHATSVTDVGDFFTSVTDAISLYFRHPPGSCRLPRACPSRILPPLRISPKFPPQNLTNSLTVQTGKVTHYQWGNPTQNKHR